MSDDFNDQLANVHGRHVFGEHRQAEPDDPVSRRREEYFKAKESLKKVEQGMIEDENRRHRLALDNIAEIMRGNWATLHQRGGFR